MFVFSNLFFGGCIINIVYRNVWSLAREAQGCKAPCHVPGVCQLPDDEDTDAINRPPIPPDLSLIGHFLYGPP